jgi:hypothetical protein
MAENSRKVGRSVNDTGRWSRQWDKVAAFSFGVVFIVVMLVISLRVPTPSETQWFVFRVVLAAAAAGVGAVIPGLLVVRVHRYIRAGGALALFLLVYWFNPPKLVVSGPLQNTQIEQRSDRSKNSNIVAGGDVIINAPAPDKQGVVTPKKKGRPK